MKILITGHTGFVGKNLYKRLGEIFPVSGYAKGGKLDCSVDTVIHLACDGDSRGSNKKLVKHTRNNLGVFVKVLESAIRSGVRRFIYVSSIEAEKELNVYAVEKAAGEKILKIEAEENGFEYVVIRPYTLFGEEMNFSDKNRNVIANFIQKNIEGKQVEIIGSVKATRQFTYIGDLLDAVQWSLIENTNKTITVSSGIETSIEDLDYMIKNLYKTIKWRVQNGRIL